MISGVMMMKYWKSWIAPVCIAGTVLAGGCADKAASSEFGHAHQLANGDLQEKTKSYHVLPSFLKDKPKPMVDVYQAAAQNADLLQWIPCYCGCGGSAGHLSSMNCFVKEIGQDGAVTWDDHGTRCNVCLSIAATSIKMKQEGKSVKEIRAYIDQSHSKGFAQPTKTKLPD